MAVTYVELVIKAPFILVKGLLLGFLHGREEPFDYFFHRKAGIRRETIAEAVREIFEIDNYTCVCLPRDVSEEFKVILNKSHNLTGAKIKSEKVIRRAEFTFGFEVFSPRCAEGCKRIFSDLPSDVTLSGYTPSEKKEEGAKLTFYAPAHEYSYRGRGKVEGEFEGAMKLYLKIKRSRLCENILCSDMTLVF